MYVFRIDTYLPKQLKFSNNKITKKLYIELRLEHFDNLLIVYSINCIFYQILFPLTTGVKIKRSKTSFKLIKKFHPRLTKYPLSNFFLG